MSAPVGLQLQQWCFRLRLRETTCQLTPADYAPVDDGNAAAGDSGQSPQEMYAAVRESLLATTKYVLNSAAVRVGDKQNTA